MRGPGQILLVACYELGHQPLAIAWPQAFLERAGYRPAVLDVSVQPFDPEAGRRARVVMISVPMHTALRLGVHVAEHVRAVNPGCHVVFFGLYAALNRDFLLARCADSVVGGEVEGALVRLAETLEAGAAGEGTPAGPQPPARPHLERLPFPVPSRAGLPPLERYARMVDGDRQALVGHVEASRGCKHRCRHCPIPPVYGGRFFVVPPEVCLADIRQCVAAGATHITFGDPDFLNGPRHALRVARALHAEWPALTFDFTAKVEHLLRHRGLLPELESLGALFVVSALESLSDTVLRHLDKGHTRADAVAVARVVRQARLTLRPTWVAFTPWTTLADYRDMLDFLEEQGLVDHVDPIQYSLRLLVPPGSLLLESGALGGHLGPLVAEAFHHPWRHPDPRMDGLQSEVSRVVEAAAAQGEDPAVTFDRVRTLADELAGVAPRAPVGAGLAAARPRPPRLTEPWFC